MHGISEEVVAAVRRLNYYATGVVRELVPRSLFRFEHDAIFRELEDTGALPALLERVNYYNGLVPGRHALPSTRIDSIDRSRSRYFIDLAEHLRFFPAHLRIDSLFGDITHVPPVPSVLKSRPIDGDNANSVLLNLDKFRHFRLFDDPVPFSKKTPRAVWRGSMNNPLRANLVSGHANSPFCDVGHVSRNFTEVPPRDVLSPVQQFQYRYIISVEGCDVATNLKWVMASGSVCIMPRPRFETWFMEGRLIPDHHYVEVRDDFSDLEEKIEALEADPMRAREIVANANRHIGMFLQRRNEKLTSLLVLQKYFEATGQLPPSAFTEGFFSVADAEPRMLMTA
ncbi:glycosyl transferase family 90 [Rhizobium sp. C4]|uniref:glycosyl transferase family 90 n=1 Tax=Rhizobium sp. C4 TaxID=1349800 RepID=UPI001E57A0EE|nr:glycosyl transferase family 90 [Rhizobium sp. C4]MCD2175817.1 lipopolysaccharide biosynthesis protein [Rhizobium sp. C4]